MCANDSKTIKNRSMLLCYHYYRLTVCGISSICYTKTPTYIVTKSVYCTLLIASSCCQVNSATFIIVPFPIKTMLKMGNIISVVCVYLLYTKVKDNFACLCILLTLGPYTVVYKGI